MARRLEVVGSKGYVLGDPPPTENVYKGRTVLILGPSYILYSDYTTITGWGVHLRYVADEGSTTYQGIVIAAEEGQRAE